MQVTTAETFDAVTRSGEGEGEHYFADWHIDNHGADGSHNFHWILLIVHKEGDWAHDPARSGKKVFPEHPSLHRPRSSQLRPGYGYS